MNVDQYINDLVEREGGYSDNPNDRGGPTNYGITEAVARAFGYQGDMRDLPLDTARSIYRARYWIQPRFSDISAISPMVAEELLDTGVNMGTSVAGRFLQRALNVLNLEGKSYPDIKVDGAIGNMTVAALRAFIDKRGKDGHIVMRRVLDAQQAVRYIEIAEARPSQEDFVYGWNLNRVGL